MARRVLLASATAIVTAVLLSISGTSAQADDDSRLEEAVASESHDVTAPEDQIVLDARGRAAVADALRSVLATPNLTVRERRSAEAELRGLVGPAAAYAAASGAVVMANPPANKVLIITHYAQERSYYCGPASAYIILKYLGYTTSRYNGVALSQTNLGASTYLNTTTSGTLWAGRTMESGINRWMNNTHYVQVGAPSFTTTKGSFLGSVGRSLEPLAADTVEYLNGAHYNGHPNRLIGHWIVGYGYANNGEQTYWADPATSYYPNASKTFTATTSSFNTFLQGNGIMY